jgi:hypothetical protein
MDPTQCYLEMLDAMQEGDLATARERAIALRDWLETADSIRPSTVQAKSARIWPTCFVELRAKEVNRESTSSIQRQ